MARKRPPPGRVKVDPPPPTNDANIVLADATMSSVAALIIAGQLGTNLNNVVLTAAGTIAIGGDPANTKYVRKGAAGAGTGDNWTDAYDELPATLQRGWTYYIADGAYGSYTFNDPVNGSLVISIKKATLADHGTNNGWVDSHGDGQAVFNAPITFTTNNWFFSGSIRNENNWFLESAYGFRVAGSSSSYYDPLVKISQNSASLLAHNVTVQYVASIANTVLPSTTQDNHCFDTSSGGNTTNGAVIHRCLAKWGTNHYFIREAQMPTVEYCASFGIGSNGANHGNVFNFYFAGDRGCIVRYNKVYDAYIRNGSGGGTNIMAISDGGDNIQFYGNLVWRFCTTNCAVGFNTSPNRNGARNSKFYNNTFVDGFFTHGNPQDDPPVTGIVIGDTRPDGTIGTNNTAHNNLWVNCSNPGTDLNGTVSHNAYSNASGSFGGTNQQLGVPTSIFVNYVTSTDRNANLTGEDFRLSGPTSAGLALSAPYNVDPLGNTRGADGIWDRGAFERV